MDFTEAFAEMPLVAILRGLAPSHAVPVARQLHEVGYRAIEVPLNSPQPLDSIKAIADELGADMAVGAGTVYTVEEVKDVRQAGGSFIVSPNSATRVIHATLESGMHSCPGALTPSEVVTAAEAGATVVKLFPAQALSLSSFKAIMEVVPPTTSLLPTGGIDAANIADYKRAGAAGAGLGSSLFRPDRTVNEIGARGAALIEVWRAAVMV